jgi:hypothetical protein
MTREILDQYTAPAHMAIAIRKMPLRVKLIAQFASREKRPQGM